MIEQFELGDDVFNSAINRMGSFRHYVDSDTIVVRTVSGIEHWDIANCTKFVSPED